MHPEPAVTLNLSGGSGTSTAVSVRCQASEKHTQNADRLHRYILRNAAVHTWNEWPGIHIHLATTHCSIDPSLLSGLSLRCGSQRGSQRGSQLRRSSLTLQSTFAAPHEGHRQPPATWSCEWAPARMVRALLFSNKPALFLTKLTRVVVPRGAASAGGRAGRGPRILRTPASCAWSTTDRRLASRPILAPSASRTTTRPAYARQTRMRRHSALDRSRELDGRRATPHRPVSVNRLNCKCGRTSPLPDPPPHELPGTSNCGKRAVWTANNGLVGADPSHDVAPTSSDSMRAETMGVGVPPSDWSPPWGPHLLWLS